MEYRYKPEDVAHYLRWQKRINKFAETFPAEVFKWFGWVSAIAAVHVVDQRLDSSWLQGVAVCLSLLLVMRVQWYFGTKHPETLQRDGSLLVRFQPWKILVSIPATAVAYFLAFYMAGLIVKSELLPAPSTPEVARAVTPPAAPAAAKAQPVAPKVERPTHVILPKAEPSTSPEVPKVQPKEPAKVPPKS